MSNKLTKKQKKELQKLADEMMDLSIEVVEDYENMPSEVSGSIVQIHGESPFLDEWLKDNKWKSVIKTNLKDAPE